MSMVMQLAVLSESAFTKAKDDSDLLEGVFQQKAPVLKSLGITKKDLAELDYLVLSEAVEAQAEAIGEGDGETDLKAEGELEYEGGYGPAMFWSSAALKRAIDDEDSSWDMALEMDAAVKKLAKRAVSDGLYLLAVVD